MKRKLLVAIGTAKHLGTCRAALPKWMRALLAVALFCTCLPGVPDLGLDEAIYLVVGTVLWVRHRPLLRACWRAAQLEAGRA